MDRARKDVTTMEGDKPTHTGYPRRVDTGRGVLGTRRRGHLLLTARHEETMPQTCPSKCWQRSPRNLAPVPYVAVPPECLP